MGFCIDLSKIPTPEEERIETMTIKDIVKDNTVSFSRYRKGYLYYTVSHDGETYEFPVDLDDVGDADFNATEKAMLLMRYIRKAREQGTFQKVNNVV
jgi:hypothetical protein